MKAESGILNGSSVSIVLGVGSAGLSPVYGTCLGYGGHDGHLVRKPLGQGAFVVVLLGGRAAKSRLKITVANSADTEWPAKSR